MFSSPFPGVLALCFLSTALGLVTTSKYRAYDASNDVPCRFDLDGHRFDLCPIMRGNERTVDVDMDSAVVNRNTTYRISMDRPLENSDVLPLSLRCPDGSWICMTTTMTMPNDPSRVGIVDIIPVAGNLQNSVGSTHPNISAHLWTQNDPTRPPPVIVTIHGGLHYHQPQLAEFIFRCDHTSHEPSTPKFLHRIGKRHVFTWDTKHACPIPDNTKIMNAALSAAEEPADPAEPPSETPDGSADDTLVPSLPISNSRRKSITFIIISLCAFPALGYLAYKSTPRVREIIYNKRHGIKSKNKRPYRFRVGPRKLLRWAQEDDFDLDVEEEDFMVNARTVEDVEPNEEMPLTPSPWKHSVKRGYGSAG
ncbi:hypothetical protein BD410DRAFT_791065 [Rickenella mellea]|uniref:Uncharacterized protein n=1 Tax=Rickenella mellea TaxID=50990 RepID=A0A4Y7PZ55_9AGAM|nr:hypothetical protein BD410DRAFT_791065 [Rickenella mellea]